jgi:hypothetical protein
MHPFEHVVVPPGHAATHSPEEQNFLSLGQTFPHVPQLFASVWRSTHAAPQALSPSLQFGATSGALASLGGPAGRLAIHDLMHAISAGGIALSVRGMRVPQAGFSSSSLRMRNDVSGWPGTTITSPGQSAASTLLRRPSTPGLSRSSADAGSFAVWQPMFVQRRAKTVDWIEPVVGSHSVPPSDEGGSVFVLNSVEQATATSSEPTTKKENERRFISNRRPAECSSSDGGKPGSEERKRDDDRDAWKADGDRHERYGPCPSTQG